MGRRTFPLHSELDIAQVQFSLGVDRNGKTQIGLHYGANMQDLNFVTPPGITQWPRCTGDGNFGTLFGPTEVARTKFVLDITDQPITGATNDEFERFKQLMDAIDDKLLQFVTDNQLRILGRKNLTKEEVRMLQLRTVRAKYDKMNGALLGHSFNMGVLKYVNDGMGGKVPRRIGICDHEGKMIKDGRVAPGDVVRATAYVSQVYTGVGGDKFGIAFGFEDVSVLAQRSSLENRAEIPVFANGSAYDFACSYVDFSEEIDRLPIVV